MSRTSILRAWRAVGVIGLLLLFSASSFAEIAAVEKLTYRGFVIDATAVRSVEQLDALRSSIAHQIDIVADCGAKAEVLRFFQGQEIIVRPDLRGKHRGMFDARSFGIEIDDGVAAPQKPIILHELLHAFHFRAMPGGYQNADIVRFYNRAKSNRLYTEGEYLLTNVQEFFAVTASLYLWGNVDREPHTREKLKATQPIYYAWLGELFGVKK
jgi:hypothetical protein